LIGTDSFGNKYYENNADELPRMFEDTRGSRAFAEI